MSWSRRSLRPLWLLFVSLLAIGSLFGQEEVLVHGVVVAEEINVVPYVEVTAVHEDSGERTYARAGLDGHFSLGRLPPGRYRITAGLGRAELADETLELESDYRFLEVNPWGIRTPHGTVSGRFCRSEADCPADVTIRFSHAANNFVREVVTRSDGTFFMDPVPRGPYMVEVRAGDARLVETTTYLGFGDENLHITPRAGVRRESRTEGLIVSPDNDLLAGESLCFVNQHADIEAMATIEGYGEFRLPEELPSGVYEVRWGRGTCGRSVGTFMRYGGMEIVVVPGEGIRIGGDMAAPPPPPKVMPAPPPPPPDMVMAPPPDIPNFDWPPPRASQLLVLPRSLVVAVHETDVSLWTTGQRLDQALRDAGYGGGRWYAVPEGFALVSRLEKINADGTPKEAPERWSTHVEPPEVHSLVSYFKALLLGIKPGYFRIVVFVVTSVPFTESETTVDRKTALEWIPDGGTELPERYKEMPFGPAHDVTALVYEFKQVAEDSGAELSYPSLTTCEQHLRNGGIWEHLPGGSP